MGQGSPDRRPESLRAVDTSERRRARRVDFAFDERHLGPDPLDLRDQLDILMLDRQPLCLRQSFRGVRETSERRQRQGAEVHHPDGAAKTDDIDAEPDVAARKRDATLEMGEQRPRPFQLEHLHGGGNALHVHRPERRELEVAADEPRRLSGQARAPGLGELLHPLRQADDVSLGSVIHTAAGGTPPRQGRTAFLTEPDSVAIVVATGWAGLSHGLNGMTRRRGIAR